MRRLSLQSRVWKSIKPPRKSVSLAILALLCPLATITCQLSNDESNEDGSWLFGSKNQTTTDLKLTADGPTLTVAENAGCEGLLEQEAFTWDWTIPVSSIFGEEKLTLHLLREKAHGPISMSVEVAEQSTPMSTVTADDAPLLKTLCKKIDADQNPVVLEESFFQKFVLAELNKINGDCKFKLDKTGVHCALSAIDSYTAADELKGIRKTMIRRWSRQPYLLSRRLSLSLTLAKALRSHNTDAKLDTLCKVIGLSDPGEVPLILYSKKWRQTVCQNISDTRVQAANFGLEKSLEEIEFLRHLFERSSKLGYLRIKVPKESTPSKDLWVSLTPKADVTENLIAQTIELLDHSKELSQPCWHPVFSGTNHELKTALILDLVSPSTCSQLKPSDFVGSKQYLADSITSETEFVITNGRSKLLRLPNGTYSYEIRAHNPALGWEPVSEKSSIGSIPWEGRRPNTTVSQW